MSDDISYAGSLIEKTFVTWVNRGVLPQETITYEMKGKVSQQEDLAGA